MAKFEISEDNVRGPKKNPSKSLRLIQDKLLCGSAGDEDHICRLCPLYVFSNKEVV